MNLTRSIMFIPLAALLLTGCATPQRSEYAAFAQAGSGYAAAVDKLLVGAGEVQVDATSWTLVADKGLSNVSDEVYRMKTDADLERLAVIRHLRSHARQLELYFELLNTLATSDVPEKTSASIDGVVRNLAELSSVLRTSTPDAFSSLTPLTRLVVDMKIRGALKNELEKRKDVIRRELQVQDRVLGSLEDQISHALSLSKEIKERKVVLDPIQVDSPLLQPEEWVEKRRKVIYMPEVVTELSSARRVVEKMSNSFESLLSGEKDAIDRINALIGDIESILAVADALNS